MSLLLFNTALLVCISYARSAAAAGGDVKLTVSNGQLLLNGEKVFLSGMNIESIVLGDDFGNGQYGCCTGARLESYLKNSSAAGGNSVRILLHHASRYSPIFNQTGFVIGTDNNGTMISDLGRFLDAARDNSVFVIVVIWYFDSNDDLLFDLLSDINKLQSYIDNVLVPMVGALKDKPALAAWEIIHSPETMVTPNSYPANPCFNTPYFTPRTAGQAVPMQSMYSFINRQVAAIRTVNPAALITVGASSALARSDSFGYKTYFSDACLRSGPNAAPNGTLSFYSISAIPSWPLTAIGETQADKPIIINSFSGEKKNNKQQALDQQMVNAYYGGFSGAFTWRSSNKPHDPDDLAMQATALKIIRDHNVQWAGGRVNVKDILKPNVTEKHVFTIVSLSMFVFAGLVVLVVIISALVKRRGMSRATSMFAVSPWSFRHSTLVNDDNQYETVSESRPHSDPEVPLLSAVQPVNRMHAAAAAATTSGRVGVGTGPPHVAALTRNQLGVHAASTPREYMKLYNGSDCSSTTSTMNSPPPRLPPLRV